MQFWDAPCAKKPSDSSSWMRRWAATLLIDPFGAAIQDTGSRAMLAIARSVEFGPADVGRRPSAASPPAWFRVGFAGFPPAAPIGASACGPSFRADDGSRAPPSG